MADPIAFCRLAVPPPTRRSEPDTPTDHHRDLSLKALIISHKSSVGRVSTGFQHGLRYRVGEESPVPGASSRVQWGIKS